MSWIISIVIVGAITALVLLSSHSPLKKKSRLEYLNEFADYLETKLELVQDKNDAYRVIFTFEKKGFVYEDFMEDGFEKVLNKVTLTNQTNKDFTVMFTEKEKSLTVKSDIFIASDVKEGQVDYKIKVKVPKEFDEFKLTTNNIKWLNELLSDKKFFSILKKFKSSDQRGHPHMSLKMLNGNLILEFQNDSTMKPSLKALHANVPSIEGILEDLIYCSNKINSLKEENQ